MNTRTIVKFNYTGDIWPIIDKWAGENGYRQKLAQGVERTYQKGTGFLVAPMMMSIRADGQTAVIQAWVRVNAFNRAMAFFIIPSEMGIQSGGFRLVIPRDIAREAFNKLLVQLGQPLIP